MRAVPVAKRGATAYRPARILHTNRARDYQFGGLPWPLAACLFFSTQIEKVPPFPRGKLASCLYPDRRDSWDKGQTVTKIWERLYLGNLQDAEQLARSNSRRIATVVSLCHEKVVRRAASITYIHIPLPDSRPIGAQKFEDVMFAIAIGLRRGNVLVHCREGLNRSPILIAAWMDRCGYAGIDKALSEIRKQRDLAPSDVLLASVKGLVGT